jgi:hypothetical protein
MAKEEQNRDAAEKAEKAEKIDETYRKLLRLYERLTAETTTIGGQGEALGKIIEELKAESSLATEFKVEVRKGIKESVDKATKEVNNQIRSSIEELVTKEVSEKVKEFNKTINDATKLLTEYAVEKSMRKYWMYLLVLFSGMICYFAGYTYMRVNNCNPDAHFSDEQLSTYRNGVTCGYFWDKLSKKTQDRLLSIKEGKLPAEEKSYEWIKDKNPKLDKKALHKKFEELNGT